MNNPTDLYKYYQNYYTEDRVWNISTKKTFLKTLRIIRIKLARIPFLCKILSTPFLDMVTYSNININSKILDVGCGSGDLLYSFFKNGFKNLHGVDLFLQEKYTNKGLNLEKKTIFDLNGKYDLIIFNHSFEHIWEQNETLKKAYELLNPKGTILLRIPILNFAYEKFENNWVQLDAPRHMYLHTANSIKILGENNQLRLTKIIYDSTDFQFWGSMQLEKGISLSSEKSYSINNEQSIFSEKDLLKFQKEAKKLNKTKRGDQASFYFKKLVN